MKNVIHEGWPKSFSALHPKLGVEVLLEKHHIQRRFRKPWKSRLSENLCATIWWDLYLLWENRKRVAIPEKKIESMFFITWNLLCITNWNDLGLHNILIVYDWEILFSSFLIIARRKIWYYASCSIWGHRKKSHG